MSIIDITLTDPTKPARPADRVVQISAVGDMAFIAICEVDEGNPTTTTTTTAEIAVSLASLRDALVLLCQDRDRESLRGRDEHGLRPDLVGRRYVQVPV